MTDSITRRSVTSESGYIIVLYLVILYIANLTSFILTVKVHNTDDTDKCIF